MQIEEYCSSEVTHVKYKELKELIPLDGLVFRFVTKTGFAGICQLSLGNFGYGNIIFRIGYVVGDTIRYSDEKTITNVAEAEMCAVGQLFKSKFAPLNDEEAEKVMIVMVKFQDIAGVAQMLATDFDINRYIHPSGLNVKEIIKVHINEETGKRKKVKKQ